VRSACSSATCIRAAHVAIRPSNTVAGKANTTMCRGRCWGVSVDMGEGAFGQERQPMLLLPCSKQPPRLSMGWHAVCMSLAVAASRAWCVSSTLVVLRPHCYDGRCWF